MKTPPLNSATKNRLPGLHLVATPIGNLGDITLRALDVLRDVDEIWCEDTRHTTKLLNLLDVERNGRNMRACHDHNEQEMAARLIDILVDGKSVAYVSDAGMPLISDPGFRLAQAVIDAELPLHVVPGVSAVTTALALSGLPSDQFAFLGFTPSKSGKRQEFFSKLKNLPFTVLMFESPKRLIASLEDLTSTIGENRQIVVLRELTKQYEEVVRGNLSEVRSHFESYPPRGEIVLGVAADDNIDTPQIEIERQLRVAQKYLLNRDAVRLVSELNDAPKNQIYELALKLKG